MNKYIDHTLLKPDATQEQISNLCKEAIKYDFMSVCVNPTHVKLSADLLAGSDVKVCTVVGFPLGASTTETKSFETKDALKNGADEVDMVINVGALKEQRYDFVRDEIKQLKDIVGDKVLKVIIEACLLTDEEIAKVSELSVEAGADYVKTSTGFSTGGATVEAVLIMKQTVGDRAQVKASGGVRSLEDFNKLVEAGATRIGASSGVAIMEGLVSKEDY